MTTTRRTAWLIAFVLASTMTITNQVWVGGMTLYAEEREPLRDRLHESILHNRLPDSVRTWSQMGANGLNNRVMVVWIAEALHRLTGMTVARTYYWIESIALFCCCLLLYAFIEGYMGWRVALAGLLYWGAVLPLTYLNHYFHPWDKPSFALWILALICLRRHWWSMLAAVLVVGVLTKYDIVVFPLLVFLAFRKTEPIGRVVVRTLALAAVAGLTFLILLKFVPGGMESRSVVDFIRKNLGDARATLYSYPPLLALGVPAILAAVGYKSADQFAKACAQLALTIAVILFLQVNFVEFRAQLPILILLFPAAFFGLLRVTGASAIPEKQPELMSR